MRRALLRHIATHLVLLSSFLTVRLKELREQDTAHLDDDSTTSLGSHVGDSSDASGHSRDDTELDATLPSFEDLGPDDALDVLVQPTEKLVLPMDDDTHELSSWDLESSTSLVSIQDDWKDRESLILDLCRGGVFECVSHRDADTDSTMANARVDTLGESSQEQPWRSAPTF